MKKTTTLVTLLFLFQISFAQQSKFSKIYFDTSRPFFANGMARTFDGGLIVCGEYDYASSVMKIDSLGAIQWANLIGFGSNETFNSVVRTADSCYVMAGKVYDSGSGTIDVYVVKISQAGNLLWSSTIYQPDNQEALSIQQTFDGGYILTGYTSYLVAPYSRIIALKLNSIGDVEWNNHFEAGNNANIGYSIKQTPDSGYAFVGYVENYPPSETNGVLCKLSKTGNIDWANKYNLTTPSLVQGSDLAIASDGIYSYYSTPTDYILVKTDFNGIDNWRETISGISPGSFCSNCVSAKMKLLPDGNILFANASRSFAQPTSVMNIDTAGNFNWSQYLINSVHDVEQADDHGFFFLGNGPLLGVRTTTLTNPHVGIIKTDSFGNADLCTTPISSVSINFGTTTSSALSLTTTSIGLSSTMISPNVTAFIVAEQVGCVDATGGIDDGEKSVLSLYPNPTSSSFKIQLAGVNGNVDLQVIDVLGQVLFSEIYNLSNEQEIKIDHSFAKGVYSVLINSSDRKIVGKIVVQ